MICVDIAWLDWIDDCDGTGVEGVWVPVAYLRSDAPDAYHDSTGTLSFTLDLGCWVDRVC
jgi:hypothetical protein